MKHLHIFPNQKFTESFIDFVNKHFDSNDHIFLVIGKGIDAKITSRDNVKKISKDLKSLLLLIDKMYKCEKIFLHGLFFKEIVFMLFIQPWLLKKSNWIVWGGDLYWYKDLREGLKLKLYEGFRSIVIRYMGGLITHIKGDYELAQLWYGAKGKYYYSFMYPSNLYKEFDLSKVNKDSEKTYIQVGNSADPTNNHLEVFNKLEKYKNEEIEIIVPLSYGNAQYRDKVIEEGTKKFGNKFNPIVDYMPFEKYLELLAKIDVAIFNHKRQQAMGNIITLLGLGKKVYIRDDITTWRFCAEHGLKVYSLNEDVSELFDEMLENEKANNINNIKKKFSEIKLKEDLTNIFSAK